LSPGGGSLAGAGSNGGLCTTSADGCGREGKGAAVYIIVLGAELRTVEYCGCVTNADELRAADEGMLFWESDE